jgi:hypothetical protein
MITGRDKFQPVHKTVRFMENVSMGQEKLSLKMETNTKENSITAY